ncbi:GAF and ANTAR domain-containing protein [Trujillonella endophytica]|uniref:ANTAR domain-containing protein n=1 Tax=Trujillonella endophytica TaxID=673521 RepID=A0A1H8SGY1_9ACTN|nr:GAF and ANTAR domain-containing protein [Trujillella endophytica]SEO77558.1 ANTAR domain-containing protein [Trujillella endophytica]
MAGTRVAEILAGLAAAGPPDTWPQLLVDGCREATHMTGIGMSFVDDAGIGEVVAATGGVPRRLAALQFALGEGPSLEASRLHRPVLCPDLPSDADARWPAFAPGAHVEGVAASFAFPLGVGAIVLGVLDLYRDVGGPLTGTELRDAYAYADAAVAVLLHLHDRARGVHLNGAHPDGSGLTDLVDRRAVVHQAVGMLSAQLDLALPDALLRLRAHAWSRDRAISDIAADVVARRLRFDHSQDGTVDGREDTGPDGEPGRTPP